MAKKNLFNPSFSKIPSIYIDQGETLQYLTDAVANENSPYRAALIDGVRGSGKTTLLNRFIEALPKKVVSIRVQNADAMLDMILDQAYKQISRGADVTSSISVLGVGLTAKEYIYDPVSFDGRLRAALEIIGKKKLVVFAIDEVQGNSENIRLFGATYNTLLAEGYNVMLAMTGVPEGIQRMIRDESLTFLRRAQRITMKPFQADVIADEYLKVFAETGKKLDLPTAQTFAAVSMGYSYAFQLIGYYAWPLADKPLKQLDIETIISQTRQSIIQNVYDDLYDDLTPKKLEFLLAMANYAGADLQHVPISHIVDSMPNSDGTKNKNAVNQMRINLIKDGLIVSSSVGFVSFALPFMRYFFTTKMALNNAWL
ncbi:MAG: hypothetical protein LBT80_05080 [Lactobacillaceae bacterium]|jgi:hypothetical protein|nr:hypothetical protein [Lactobacillaceae bacterium]